MRAWRPILVTGAALFALGAFIAGGHVASSSCSHLTVASVSLLLVGALFVFVTVVLAIFFVQGRRNYGLALWAASLLATALFLLAMMFVQGGDGPPYCGIGD